VSTKSGQLQCAGDVSFSALLDGIATGTFRLATPAKQVCAEWLRQPSPEGHAPLGDSNAAPAVTNHPAHRRGWDRRHQALQGGAASAFIPGTLQATCHSNGRAMSVKPVSAIRR
jgi:hypothetical protein